MRSVRSIVYTLGGIAALLLASVEAPSGSFVRHPSAPDTTLPPPDSIPYVQYIQTFPARPNSGQPTVVAIVGGFPFPCGEVFLANARDSAHFVISIRPRASCPDSTLPGATWFEALQIGPLPPGIHHTELEFTVLQDPAAPPGEDRAVYHGSFEFYVLDYSSPVHTQTWGALKRRYR